MVDYPKTEPMTYSVIRYTPGATAKKQSTECNKNPDLILDYLVFLLMIGVAITMLWQSDIKGTGIGSLLGAGLFSSCIVAALASVSYCLKGKCARETWLKAHHLVNVVLLITAILLNPRPDDGWVKTSATPLFETACIFWIYQGLFRHENPQNEADRLNKRLEQLEHLVAIGLADGYFWNFVFPQGNLLLACRQRQLDVTVSVELSRDDKYEAKLITPVLFVLVPGCFCFKGDSKVTDNPITDVVQRAKDRALSRNAALSQGLSTSRPFWLTLMKFEERKSATVDVLYDIPTTLNVLFKNLLEHTEDATRDGQAHMELNAFKSRLAWLLQRHGLDQCVRIVEFGHTDD